MSHYENMEVSLERYNVVYYGWSVLWTHVHNFKRVIQLNQTRDYFINMAGKLSLIFIPYCPGIDMPIKTRREINYFLGEHMGMSFIYEHCEWPHYRQWWRNFTWAELSSQVVQVNEAWREGPPNLELRWGQHYVMLHRDMVEWMFDDVRILHLLSWLQNTMSPDEMFYATVVHNSPYNTSDRLFTHNNFKYATWEKCCTGYELTAGHPCVLGVCDLPKLSTLNHLWVTKIDSTYDPNLAPALKQILQKRTEEEEATKKVKRIPLFPNQQLIPEYIDIN